MEQKKKEQIVSSLLGFVVGDALGVPYEFMESKEIKALGKIRMLDKVGYHRQSIGTWSDDSSMMFCTIESLLNGYNPDDMGIRFCRWWRDKDWTPHGKVFDIGQTTRLALAKVNHFNYAKGMGGTDEYSNGNGSLMRVLPISYFLLDEQNLETRKRIVEEVSGITHNHIYSKIGCVFYVEFVIQLLNGQSKKRAYRDTIDIIKTLYTEEELQPFSRIISGKVHHLKAKQLSGSGYVVHSLESCLWAFLRHHNYIRAVTTVITLGEDTDTNAALTGGLAALYYEESIPAEWIEPIVKKEDILKLFHKFKDHLN